MMQICQASCSLPLCWLAAIAAPAAAPTANEASRSLVVFLVIVFAGLPLLFLWTRFVRPMHLALGFAATAVLWALGYVALMQPGLVAGEALFGLMLVVLFVAGWVAGRYGDADVRPVSVGLVSAIANLLVIGAFLRDDQHGSNLTPVVWTLGLIGASAALAWLGGLVGRRMRASARLPEATALFALVTAIAVFVMIVLGGVLTGYEAGLAVPDWPNSYGHNMLLYPVSEMKGGVFYEHVHRLYGMLVGATAAVLVAVVWRDSQVRWLRWLAVSLLCMVCVQGLLGGLRVTGRATIDIDRSLLAPSTTIAIVHGVFAQVVFSAALVIAAATSRLFRSDVRPLVAPWASTDRGVALMLPFAVLVQLIFGALYRHLQPSGGASAPGHPTWAIHAHLTMAVIVTGLVLLAAGRAWGHAGHPVLRRTGKTIVLLTALQLVLGVIAVAAVWTRKGSDIPTFEVAATTVHQGVGAMILGLSTVLAVWSYRLLADDAPVAATAAAT